MTRFTHAQDHDPALTSKHIVASGHKIAIDAGYQSYERLGFGLDDRASQGPKLLISRTGLRVQVNFINVICYSGDLPSLR